MTVPSRPNLILINLAGADWRFLHPLIDAGAMPNLERLITDGVMGNLYSARPLNRPTLDATLATGQYADRHRVLHELSPDADAPGFRRTGAADWAAPALWDMVTARGKSAATIGWPATHPTHSLGGLVVSDRFCDAQGKSFETWPFDPTTVSDPSVGAALAELRMHPRDVSHEMLSVFIPEGDPIDFETDARPGIFADCLARASTTHAAATWIAEHATPDLLTVHFDFLATLKSQFVDYRAPRMGHVTEADFARFTHVVNSAYQFADMMLAPYLSIAGPDGSVMLVSGHGFLDGSFRLGPARKGTGAHGARNHRELGMIVAKTPGAAPDTLTTGITTVDVVPTALAILGLEAEPDLPGRVIATLGTAQPTAAAATPLPQHPPAAKKSGGFRVAQLIELEILAKPNADAELARDMVHLANGQVLIEALMAQKKFAAALVACEDALTRDPGQMRVRLDKLRCLVELSRFEAAREWLTTLRDSEFAPAEIALLEARIEHSAGATDKVTALLEQAEATAGSTLARLRVLEKVGLLHLERKDDVGAERVLTEALTLDPKSSPAQGGLGRLYLRRKEYEKAVKYLTGSLAKFYEQPFVHLRLGDTYFRMGNFAAAEMSYDTAMRMAPNLTSAKDGRARAAMKRQEVAGA